MEPLEQATTSQLLDELAKRHTGVIFCAIRPDEEDVDPEDPEEGDELRFYYRGGLTLAYGLCKRFRRLLDIEAETSERSLEDASDEPEEEEA